MGLLESTIDSVLSGTFSGILTRGITQPLDVVKVRMQLQVEKIRKVEGSKYTSFHQTVSRIIREEGVLALWKGHLPAQALSITYCAVQFPVYEAMKTSDIAGIFMAGGVAGVAATVTCYPIDMLRTRLIAQGHQKIVYNGIIDGVVKLCRADGILGFYKGLTPSCILIFPQAAIQFHLYEFLKVFTTPFMGNAECLVPVISGFVAGLVAKSAVYPLDVVKKRMQIQGFEEARRPFGRLHVSHGFVHSVTTLVRNEGISALFKGYVPSALKAGFVTCLTFFSYELGLSIARGRS